MSLFDEQIRQVFRYQEHMADKGNYVREVQCPWPVVNGREEFPFKVGPGAGSGLVLKSETFLELGSPTAGSCAFALFSDQTSAVHDGRVRLIGPDIHESDEKTYPFGQVIMAAGADLTEADYHSLCQSQYVGDQVEGFMVKSTPGHIWGRVSRQAAQKGFNFAFLGGALIALVKAQIPHVTHMEVLFVTSDKADLQPLVEIGGAVAQIAKAIKERHWKERGIDIDECAFGGHCGNCSDKSVCDEVKKHLHSRKHKIEELDYHGTSMVLQPSEKRN
ncbi:carbon monoxide dehydrogenase [Geobacter sp. FeAm09]|uniref:carbon monoxide dehydrogenase n=1 Tax=Geobacter sp. FeAm09 TaxID=2597769 RepID=UPI0011EC7BBB|nr:carbon monoxide dehydrogenase [Geobacter sp. FeAm09]QEM67701.1 carbon monoxide dehydrogenase [Geobacter sp. FeAm09]